jgi:hypothetical protein
MGTDESKRVVFFNVNEARDIPNQQDNIDEQNLIPQSVTSSYISIPKSVVKSATAIPIPAEDVRMTNRAFNSLIGQMIPIETSDIPLWNPPTPNIFNQEQVPLLGCATARLRETYLPTDEDEIELSGILQDLRTPNLRQEPIGHPGLRDYYMDNPGQVPGQSQDIGGRKIRNKNKTKKFKKSKKSKKKLKLKKSKTRRH